MRYLTLSLAVSLLTVALHAQEMPSPAAPTVEVSAPGPGRAAYWVVAENAAGERTTAGEPAVVNALPVPPGPGAPVTIRVTPVEHAVKYHVLKTVPMDAGPPLKVTAAAPGERRVYYWVQWHNGWRQSGLSGPAEVACADPKGNTITWEPLPDASFYHVFRTDTPEPPVGRGLWVVGQQVGGDKRWPWSKPGPCEIVDNGNLTQLAVGYEPTALTEPPLGAGLFLVGETDGTAPVVDHGQPLKRFAAPNANLSARAPIEQPASGRSDITKRLGAQIWIDGDNSLKHLNVPSFAGGHAETLVVWNQMNTGGHSEYHGGAQGTKGWKSWVAAISARLTSHTASQHGALTSHLDSYGSGDAIPFGLTLMNYGTNNDDGDEGCYLMRNHSIRRLNAWDGTLAADAPRGSRRLTIDGRIDFNDAGTERLVVNLSQVYAEGRITRVGNVDVHGKGTRWTSEMIGRYISFDVDTVEPSGGKYGATQPHRMWYWITDVKSPTELTILAKTGWSSACNLGYSRFIWDPETMDGPQPQATNGAALRYLPPAHEAAARDGGYQLAPGVRLGDPWKEGRAFNTEPLTESWRAGDRIRIVAGPQTYQALSRHVLHGDFLPQDQVNGISIGNRGNRIANFAGISIGNTGSAGFREGMLISLDRDGYGDGLVISAANRWDEQGLAAGQSGVHRAAIVVPENLPAMVGEHDWKVPHLRWRLRDDDAGGAIEIARKNGDVLASVDQAGTTTARQLHVEQDITLGGAIEGNGRTRGKTTFSGDGATTRFRVKFAQAVGGEPVIVFNTNQFARSRLVSINPASFDLEFEQPPEAGKENITVWWMAQR